MNHHATNDTLLLIAGAAAVAATTMIYVGWAIGFSVAFAILGYIGLAISAWLFGVLARQQGERSSPIQTLDSLHALNTSSDSLPPQVGSTIALGLLGAATTAFSQGNYITFVVLALLTAFAGMHFYGSHLSTLWEPSATVPQRK